MGNSPAGGMAGFGGGAKGTAMQDAWSNYSRQAGLSGGSSTGLNPLLANAAPAAGTVPAAPAGPPTTNDAAMGPSYMPAQPDMAGAPVAAAPVAPKPAAAKPKVAAKPTTPAKKAQNPEYRLQVPTGRAPGVDMGAYKMFVDNWNANPNQTLGGYLSTRDQLAKLMANPRGRNRGSSGGGNYTSSGPSSGGGRLA